MRIQQVVKEENIKKGNLSHLLSKQNLEARLAGTLSNIIQREFPLLAQIANVTWHHRYTVVLVVA